MLSVMESSNDLARELIDMYFEEDERFAPTVLVAESQPNARGRKGRWLAPAGKGLYFTIVRQARTGEPISLMPIAMARWLRQALKRSFFSKLGAVMASGALQALRRKLDPRTQNGGVFLGLNGIVVKSHGGADAVGFASAIDVRSPEP